MGRPQRTLGGWVGRQGGPVWGRLPAGLGTIKAVVDVLLLCSVQGPPLCDNAQVAGARL